MLSVWWESSGKCCSRRIRKPWAVVPGGTFKGHLLPANRDCLRNLSQAGRTGLQPSTGLYDSVESLVSYLFGWLVGFGGVVFLSCFHPVKITINKTSGFKHVSQYQHCRKQYEQLVINKARSVPSRVWLTQGEDPLPDFQPRTVRGLKTHVCSQTTGSVQISFCFKMTSQESYETAIRSQAGLCSGAAQCDGPPGRVRHSHALSTNLPVFLWSESINLTLSPFLSSLWQYWPQQGRSFCLPPLTSVFIDFFFSVTWFKEVKTLQGSSCWVLLTEGTLSSSL